VLVVFFLILLRALPFEIAVFSTKFLLRVYATLIPVGRSQLLKAADKLGEGKFSKNDYINRTAFNMSVMARMGTMLSRTLTRQVLIEGEENIRRLRDRGACAVVTTFHYGPWELLAEAFTQRGYSVAALAGRQRMSIFDRYLTALRRRGGLIIINDFKAASRALDNGVFLATFLDKTRRARKNTWNMPYSDYNVSVIPERIAQRTNTDLLPVMCRFRNKRLEIKIGKTTDSLAGFFHPFFTETPCEWLVWGD